MEKEKTIKKKLQEKISGKKSKWLEDAKFEEENEAWLDKSAQIAIKILRYLRANKISQLELSKRLLVSPQYVSKIMKGKENLSLETICKIEEALGVTLIEVPLFVAIMDIPGEKVKYKKGVSRIDAIYAYREKRDYVSYSNYKGTKSTQITAA